MTARWVVCAGTCALVGTWSAQASASHCSGCTQPLPATMEVAPAVIPPTGPLVITTSPEFPWKDYQIDPVHWETIDVEVRSSDGVLVGGSMQVLDGFSPRLWYPATPLPPGSYTVTTSVVPVSVQCPPWAPEFQIEVQPDVALPETPEVVVTADAGSRTLTSFTNYVCCEGALPYPSSEPGTGCFPSGGPPVWGSGFCAPQKESHWLGVNASIEDSAEGFFTLRETTTMDRPQVGSTALDLDVYTHDCLEFEVLNLYTGDSTVTQWCPDADAKLSVHPIDGAAEEAALRCGCTAYVCEYENPDSCRSWPDGGEIEADCPPETDTDVAEPEPEVETDTDPPGPGAIDSAGCGCSQHGSGRGSLLLTLLALAAFIRRGRRTSAVTKTLGPLP